MIFNESGEIVDESTISVINIAKSMDDLFSTVMEFSDIINDNN
jgi:hypothetical protein